MLTSPTQDIIDVVDEDDGIIDEEATILHDLAYSDDEDLVNLDIDDGVNVMCICHEMLHRVTAMTVAVMIVPLHTRYPPVFVGVLSDNRGKGTRKPNLGGRRAGRLHTRQETQNLGLKAITNKNGPVPIRFEFGDRETLMPLGDHEAHWANYLKDLVRELPLHYPSWWQISPERKAGVVAKIGTQFDLRPHMESDRWPQIYEAIQQHLQKIYNGKKAALKESYWVREEDGTYDVERIRRGRPSHISEVDWDAQIAFWNDPKNLARASQNKQNQAKSKGAYGCILGNKREVEHIPPAHVTGATNQELENWNKIYDIHNEATCLMLSSMTLEHQRQFENYSPYDMLQELKYMFEKQAGVESYVEKLECLSYVLPQDISVGLILNGLIDDFADFVRNYNMHNTGKTIDELHALLIEIQKPNKKPQAAKGKGKGKGKGKNKLVYASNPKNLKPFANEQTAKDDAFYHCKEVGHSRRNCLVYLAELMKKKKQAGTANTSGIRGERTLKQGAVYLYVGYPKETMCYYFYFPPENKIVVVRHAKFLEKNLISQEVNGRPVEHKEIQDEDTPPSENTSKNLVEPEGFKPLQEDVALLRSLALGYLPPNGKNVGSKWLFKKKTNMDGNVHAYKARLVVKGYTQTFGVDYEETFSPVEDIRAIRILIVIAAFYDYEIWKMDVKIDFSNGYLDGDIYMTYLGKCFAMKRFRMDNSKRGNIPMQERLDLNKTQGASTPEEVKREQNWTAVKNILKYLRNTKDMFLVYGGNPEAELRVTCYYDAGSETDRDDIKSLTRYVFVLNGGVVDWKSSKKNTTTMSAT
ncbi:retrotransposon protein, putative, ty1-copia subclass [Tanacetum coccineum]